MASGSSNPEAAENCHHVINMILEEVPEVELGVTQKCCIYKVPDILRKSNPEAYTPQLISIGPIHHDDKELKPMENQKRVYFHFFWYRRLVIASIQGKFFEFRSFLKEKEEEIRDCYSQKFPQLSRFEFVDMIFLDAVFIMELFLRKSREYEHKEDYMFKKAWLKKHIELDLLMIENQLPIFVLKKLYETVVPKAFKKPKHTNFLDLAREYFSCYDPKRDSENSIKLKQWKNSSNFTELIRYFFIPQKLSYDGDSQGVVETATKLRKAGISFEPVKNKCLLDIELKKPLLSFCLCFGWIPLNCIKARLRIPILKVDGSTECVVQNVIAFEQCHYPNRPYISNYFSLIGDLILSKEDVELLVEKEVIVHRLGSHKEMVTLVNKLCNNVVITQTCYGTITKKLEKHYYNKWNRLMAKLRFVYFGDLWRATATLVGFAILLFGAFNFVHIAFRWNGFP